MRLQTSPSLRISLFACALVLTGCAPADESTETADPETAPAAAPAETGAQAEPSAATLWTHLNRTGYTSWPLWPGKGERYEGGAPHGALLTTYLNDLAHDALTSGAASMPDGAIIVKENYSPGGELMAVTTMHKVAGYNPEAADWHWVKFLPDGSVDNGGMAQGKVPMCIGCHAQQAANDYVLTAPLGAGG